MMQNNYNNRNKFKHKNPWDIPSSYAQTYCDQNVQENVVNDIQYPWRTPQRHFSSGQRPPVNSNENNLNNRNTTNFSNCFYQLDIVSDYVQKDQQFISKKSSKIENELSSSEISFSQQEARKKNKKLKSISLPKRGQPGGLDDPLRKGLSGAGVRWYMRFLAEGNTPYEARKLALAKKITVTENFQTPKEQTETKKRKSDENPDLFKREKLLQNVRGEKENTSENIPTVSSIQNMTESETISDSLGIKTLNSKYIRLEKSNVCDTKIVSGIQIQILAKDEKNMLKYKDLTELEESIIDEVAQGWNIKVIFSALEFGPGTLLIVCANEETANWLIERISQLRTWKGVDLIARRVEKFSKPCFFTMVLPRSKKEEIDRALALLEAQNPGITTGTWKIINATDINSDLILKVAIDSKSLEIIEKSEYNLYYRFGKIKIKGDDIQSLYSFNVETVSKPSGNKPEELIYNDLIYDPQFPINLPKLEVKRESPNFIGSGSKLYNC